MNVLRASSPNSAFDPALPERLLRDIDRLLDASRPRVAILLLDALAVLACDPHEAAFRRARAHLALGAPFAALQALGAATGTLAPLWRARARLAAGDPAGALADAAHAAALAPCCPQAVGLFATLSIQHAQPGAAAAALRHAIGRGADDSALHVALAVALLARGEADAARAAVLRGLAAHPRNAALRRLLHSPPATTSAAEPVAA